MKLFLLPRWSRWLGVALTALGLFAYTAIHWNFTLSDGSNTLLSEYLFPFESADYLSYAFPLLGLLFISLARLKKEDERTLVVRTIAWHKAILISVLLNAAIFGLYYFEMLDGFVDWLYGKDSFEGAFFGVSLLGFQLILVELVFIIIFYTRIYKYARNEE